MHLLLQLNWFILYVSPVVELVNVTIFIHIQTNLTPFHFHSVFPETFFHMNKFC